MTPDLQTESPVVDYLLKEVSFSTCDNKFFGELEKEMLIPNNLNIYGRVKGAVSLKGYKLRLEFPDETVIAYLKQPLSNTTEDGRRILTYQLEDLINYEDYWWLPTDSETEFSLALSLLPPFPKLNPVDLAIACRPDIVVGVEASVTTTVRIEAEEHIDNIFLTMSVPPFNSPGVTMAITDYSEDSITEPRQSVTSPTKKFPLPRLSMEPGNTKEYRVKTKILADITGMTSLKCQQDLLKTRLLLLSESTQSELPCAVTVLDDRDRPIPVTRTVRSTILQALAQVMYSPFSIRLDKPGQLQKRVIEAAATA
jgi:hypothetical protein